MFFSHANDLGQIYALRLLDGVVSVWEPKPVAGTSLPRLITSLAPAKGSTLLLADPLSRTIYSYDLETRALTSRSLSFPPRRIAWLAPDKIAVNGLPRSPALAGTALHYFLPDGAPQASFGGFGALFRPDVAFFGDYEMSVAPGGGLWTARKNAYVLEKWDSGGKVSVAFRGVAPWFPDWIGAARWPRDELPKPRVGGIQVDDAGRLWVVIQVPRADYFSEMLEVPSEGRPYLIPADISASVDTEIQVLDVDAGRMIARTRIHEYVESFAGDGTLLTLRKNALSGFELRILKFELIDKR